MSSSLCISSKQTIPKFKIGAGIANSISGSQDAPSTCDADGRLLTPVCSGAIWKILIAEEFSDSVIDFFEYLLNGDPQCVISMSGVSGSCERHSLVARFTTPFWVGASEHIHSYQTSANLVILDD